MVNLTYKQVSEMNAKLDKIKKDVEFIAAAMRDMKNDLCILCGRYKMAHKGACDGCRWRDM